MPHHVCCTPTTVAAKPLPLLQTHDNDNCICCLLGRHMSALLARHKLGSVVHDTCQINILCMATTYAKTLGINHARTHERLRTFWERPPQSWVESVTSTRLYTLNHSGW